MSDEHIYDQNEDGQFVDRETGDVVEPTEPPEEFNELMPPWLLAQHMGES